MEQFRKAKIVATLGPASSSEEMIRRLAKAGANVFRLNFSHGTHEAHKQNAVFIRKIEQELSIPLAIMMDLQGPKIRIGIFEGGHINLKKGAKFSLDLEKEFGNFKRVTLPHPEIFNALREGTELLLDDGKVRLRVEENNGREIVTEVIYGGQLSNKKGVNIPNVVLPINALTEKDKADVAIADEIGADWVAISFVQTADDITYAKSFINPTTGVLAKIEKPSAVEKIESILEVSDAIMVARGDLGVELPFESIPGIQRMLINKARMYRKPVIVATQMLESMTSYPVPTRAEVSDVSCAIAEGADAVMLSAESASGNYPEEAVKTMAKIVEKTEKGELTFFDKSFENLTAISQAVEKTVEIDKIDIVAAFSETGRCATNVSNGRPKANLVAFTPNLKTQRKLSLVWGVKAILVDEIFSFSQMVQITQRAICKNFEINDDTKAAIVAGIPFRASGQTNLLYVYTINKDMPSGDE